MKTETQFNSQPESDEQIRVSSAGESEGVIVCETPGQEILVAPQQV